MERRLSSERRYLLERVDDAAVVQLYADGFAGLAAPREGLDLAPVSRGACRTRYLLRPASRARASRCASFSKRSSRTGWHRPRTFSQEIQAVYETVLDQQRPVQQRDRPKVRPAPHATGVARGGVGRRRSGRRIADEGRRISRDGSSNGWRQCFWILQWIRQ